MNWLRSILLVLVVGGSAFATDPHYIDLYEKANAAYKEGDYDSAKSYYNEIAQNGLMSAELFYNLGNTHFKQDNLAAAILYYERALRLNPQDEDVRYNLEIARSRTVDKIEAMDRPFFVQWWRDLSISASTGFWTVVYLLILCSSATLLTFFFVSRNVRIRQLGLLGGLGLIPVSVVIYLLANTSHGMLNKNEAIVFSPSVSVKNEPGLNATDQFVLHEGVKVEVLDEEGDWTRIELADGNSGWLQTNSIESI